MEYSSAMKRNEVLTHHNMDEPWQHQLSERSQARIYDSIHMKCQKRQTCREKVDEWLPGAGGLLIYVRNLVGGGNVLTLISDSVKLLKSLRSTPEMGAPDETWNRPGESCL